MKEVILFLLLTLIKVAGYSQLPISSLFELESSVTATSKTTLEQADGFGESFYYTEKLPNGNLKARYTYNKSQPPNPFFITYTYGIEALPSGDFALDMQAAMQPFLMYNDTNSVTLSYTGDKIVLLNYPIADSLMPDAEGIFVLRKILDESVFLTYAVSVKNRKFIKNGNFSANGLDYEIYEHTYHFSQKTILNNGNVLSVIEEDVVEWFIPGHGQVFQERTGTRATNTTQSSIITDSSSKSTLLTIKTAKR